MSKIMKCIIAFGVLVSVGFVDSAPVEAAYPERAINYIVAYRVGGGSDRTSRAFVPFLEKHLGKGAKIAIINKPGAGGNIGFNAIANAKPDGYTIGMTNFPQAIVGPIMGKVKYTIKDFDFLGNVNRGPTTFAVLKTSKYKTLADLMADVKKNPGKISIGMAALSSVHSIGTSKFMVKTGLKFNKVPFGGGGPARNALLGGHVPALAISMSAIAKFRDKVRILAQAAPERVAIGSWVPTFKEQGVDITNFVYRPVAAPKGVPAPILAKLRAAFKKAIADPGFLKVAKKQKIAVEYTSGEEMANVANASHMAHEQLWKTNPWMKKKKK